MYTEQSLKWVWWSQLLYSVRSCEQHMLSRDVQLHCVRNKKAFICQKKSCGHYILFSSYQRSNKCAAVTLSFLFTLHQLKHRWNIWWITHITFFKCARVLQNINTWYAVPCCWRVLFSNPGYAISCLPVRSFSWASSENVYKIIIKMSTGWVCVVLWYQTGHSVSCMNILFWKSQITRSDIRPDIKWAVSLVIAYGLFNLSLNTTFFVICRPLWNPLVFALWLLKQVLWLRSTLPVHCTGLS